jgi:hypothetical protein
VSGWGSNVGQEYVFGKAANGIITAQYMDTYCGDNSPTGTYPNIQSKVVLQVIPQD